MKVFLGKFLVILVVFSALLIGLDFHLSKELIRSNHPSFLEWKEIYYGKIDAEVLILGSSRASNLFDPMKIESITGKSTYNLGYSAANFHRVKGKFEAYLKKNRAPEEIFLVIDFHSFQDPNFRSSLAVYPFIYNDPRLLKLVLEDIDFEGFNILPLARYAELRNLNSLLVKIEDGEFSFKKSYLKGFSAINRPWDEEAREGELSLLAKPEILNGELLHEFEDFNADLLKNGIKVTWIVPPIYKDYLHRIELKNEFIKRIKGLADSLNVNFIDLSEPTWNADKDFFFNALHLNLEGVSRFMEDLEIYLNRKN